MGEPGARTKLDTSDGPIHDSGPVTQPWTPERLLSTTRPAVSATTAFMAGIFVHAHFPHAAVAWASLAAASLTTAVVMRGRGKLCSLFLAVALLASGIAIAQLEAFYYPRGHIGAYATERPRLAQLELFLHNEPRVLADPFAARPMPPKQVVTAQVNRVLTRDGWRDSSGEILVQIAQPHPQLRLGQRLRVLGMLERPAPASNPGQFDWAAYYRDQRILASIHIPNAENISIQPDALRVGPVDHVRRTARGLLAEGFTAAQSLDHALLRALLLGDSDPEMRDVQEQFKKTGTSHHLAISGMHVAVLGGFVLILCRVFLLRPRVAILIMLAFVLLYGIAALPSPPVVRSILLCVAFGVGMLLRRSLDAINLLAASVMAMLVYHPLDLFNPGFQLSFGTVLGLMLFAGPASQWLAGLRRDPLDIEVAPALARPRSPLSRAGEWAESHLATIFAAAMVAWLVSAPLILFHFEQANFWAVPASILLAPAVLLSLIGGLAKVVLTLLIPSMAALWATMAAAPIGWMRGTLSHLAALPYASYPVPGLPLWGVVGLFAIYWFFWRVPCKRPKLVYLVRATPVAVLVATMLLPLRSLERAVAPDELRLTLLAVGAGQAALVEAPGGRTVMIDSGSNSLSDPLRKCIAPFLRTRGHTRIETLLLTHSDYDHINSAAAVAQVYDVREVLTGSRFRAASVDNPPAEGLLRHLESLDLPPRVVRPGETIPIGRGVELHVLWPPPVNEDPKTLSSNDSAVVARLSYAGRSILITGDIQRTAQEELLARPDASGQLRADVLIAPHHGSSEDSTADFLRAVDPQWIVSSNDRTLTGKQRRLDRLAADINRRVYRTNDCGAITVRIASDGTVTIEPFLANAKRIKSE